MAVEIPATFHGSDGITRDVVIVDRGEGYDPEEKGSIPNHDKVEIVYQDSE